MTTQEVANRLVELCRTGQHQEAHNELYANNCVSIEPKGAPMEVCEGIEAINQKGQQFYASIEEMHNAEVSDPIVAGNHFSVTMINDATFKERGRMKMEEVCVYEVQDGKIVKETFYYNM